MNNCTYHLISKLNDLSATQLQANCIVMGKNQDSFLNPTEAVSFEGFIHLIIKSQCFIKKHNLSKVDSIVLLEAPSPKLYATIVGALSLGIQIIFIEPWLPVLEIEMLLSKLKPKILFCNFLTKKWLDYRGLNLEKISQNIKQHGLATILNENHKNKNIEILNLADEHPGICTFTSGTSGGKSKGVQRTHRKLINQFEVIGQHRPMGDLKHYDFVIFPNLVLNNLSNLKPSILFQRKKLIHDHKIFLNIPKSCQPDTMAINPGTLKFFLENKILFKSFKHIKVGGALLDCWIAEHGINALPSCQWSHIYGSTEAEPVALGNLENCLEESLKKNFFQVLCLGKKINECTHQLKRDQIMWIHGKHVSEFYIENEKANLENKFTDMDGKIWHCLGDRIEFDNTDNNYMWFMGRQNQTLQDFFIEQKFYSTVKSSQAFLYDKKTIILDKQKIKRYQQFENGTDHIFTFINAIIQRDRRHLSRIDREKTLLKLHKSLQGHLL